MSLLLMRVFWLGASQATPRVARHLRNGSSVDFFMVLVDNRDAATLIPLIQANVIPGTTIWTDGWLAYGALGAAGYQHASVNHSIHYVDPLTGVHTNHIESRWNACKHFLKAKWGISRQYLPTYLDEYMWMSRRPREQLFGDIISAIRRRYPV